jgi:hypothetical protein
LRTGYRKSQSLSGSVKMDKLNNAIEWLKREVIKEKFGEITLKIVIHENEIKRIERTVTEKEQ